MDEKQSVSENEKNVSENPDSTTSETCLMSIFSNIIMPNTWFYPERLNPTVEAFIYWRDPKLSGIVFGSSLVLLLSMAYFSLISVIANTSLVILVCAIVFRIYKDILQAVQKSPQTHPYSVFLSRDIKLPQEKVNELVDVVILHINACLGELRRLFLVEDMIESLKFALVLWVLTYVGSWFNGLTLVIIGFVALFTLPKVYENNKVQIDQNLALARVKLEEITNKIKDALPAPLRRKLPEKKEQ
ncbi:hypothetical protein PGB90_008517 [Kerria lacca]